MLAERDARARPASRQGGHVPPHRHGSAARSRRRQRARDPRGDRHGARRGARPTSRSSCSTPAPACSRTPTSGSTSTKGRRRAEAAVADGAAFATYERWIRAQGGDPSRTRCPRRPFGSPSRHRGTASLRASARSLSVSPHSSSAPVGERRPTRSTTRSVSCASPSAATRCSRATTSPRCMRATTRRPRSGREPPILAAYTIADEAPAAQGHRARGRSPDWPTTPAVADAPRLGTCRSCPRSRPSAGRSRLSSRGHVSSRSRFAMHVSCGRSPRRSLPASSSGSVSQMSGAVASI